jgi:hypothetical protein
MMGKEKEEMIGSLHFSLFRRVFFFITLYFFFLHHAIDDSMRIFTFTHTHTDYYILLGENLFFE